jgi:hypothetical protein
MQNKVLREDINKICFINNCNDKTRRHMTSKEGSIKNRKRGRAKRKQKNNKD